MLSREYRFGKDHVLEVAPTWFSPVAWCYDNITSTAEFVITDRLSFIAVNLSRNDIESILAVYVSWHIGPGYKSLRQDSRGVLYDR